MVHDALFKVVLLSGLTSWAAQGADPLPSIVKLCPAPNSTLNSGSDWTVTILKKDLLSFGKCKIYDAEPSYDADGNLNSMPAAKYELKGDGSKAFLKKNTTYWFIIYPKNTVVNHELEFVRAEDTKNHKTYTTILNIKGLQVGDISVTKPSRSFNNDNPNASFISNNFQLTGTTAPFITLN